MKEERPIVSNLNCGNILVEPPAIGINQAFNGKINIQYSKTNGKIFPTDTISIKNPNAAFKLMSSKTKLALDEGVLTFDLIGKADKKGWLEFKLKVADKECPVRIIISEDKMEAPNFFSPNEDGVNEYWYVPALPNPTIFNNHVEVGRGVGSFSIKQAGFTGGGTKYHARAFAVNSYGVFYGEEKIFFTQFDVPTIQLSSIKDFGLSAFAYINIPDSGGKTITQRGIVYSTTENPTTLNDKILSGTGIGEFSITITGLTQKTTYFVRAFASNEVGTAYSNQIKLTTNTASTTISDIEGNTYITINIGNQI